MTIERTVTIPADRRVFFEFLASGEIPPGPAKIEVTVTPAVDTGKPVTHNAFGRLSAYADPSRRPEEKGAWEAAAMEKYANH